MELFRICNKYAIRQMLMNLNNAYQSKMTNENTGSCLHLTSAQLCLAGKSPIWYVEIKGTYRSTHICMMYMTACNNCLKIRNFSEGIQFS